MGIKYFLRGFGFSDLSDYSHTTFNMLYTKYWFEWVSVTVVLGGFRTLLDEYMGLDLVVFIAFIVLILAEFHTGLKVARKVRGERFKSRKFGRMFLKIGTYILILTVLYSFTKQVDVPDFFGVSANPFVWLYYMFFIGVVLQLFISWMENLGQLGYRETKSLAGFFLRKFNKWFEFDGSKDNADD